MLNVMQQIIPIMQSKIRGAKKQQQEGAKTNDYNTKSGISQKQHYTSIYQTKQR